MQHESLKQCQIVADGEKFTCDVCNVAYTPSPVELKVWGDRWQQMAKRDCQPGYREAVNIILAEQAAAVDAADGAALAVGLTPPSLLRKADNLLRAGLKQVRAGNPICTAAQIEERFIICRGCELFQPGKDDNQGTCLHPKCGCPLSRFRQFRSKTNWGTGDCPLGKWPPLDQPQLALPVPE